LCCPETFTGLGDGFHNEWLKESSEARKRDWALKVALRTKTWHGREIGEANATIGLRWMRLMRGLLGLGLGLGMGMGMGLELELELGLGVSVRSRRMVPMCMHLEV
jgi:hypothetical protein